MNLGSYTTRTFSEADKLIIDRYFVSIKGMLVVLKVNMDLGVVQAKDVELNHLNAADLRRIVRLVAIKQQISNISYKIETCLEYQNLKNLITHAENMLKDMNEYVSNLRNILPKKYSDYSKNHVSFLEALPFSDFKAFFDDFFKDETLTNEQLTYFDENNFFDQIKLNLIVSQTNIVDLVSKSPKKIIDFSQVKSENPQALSLIQKEFFHTLCRDYFDLKMKYGKTSHSEIIAPSHSQAKKLKITSKENGILSLSLNPINQAKLALKDTFQSRSLPFQVTTVQDSTKINFFYQLKLNKTTSINLQMPIYLSFIRSQLTS